MSESSRPEKPGAVISGSRPKKGNGGPKCPICGQPSNRETRPFCSERCKAVDLSRWLTGSYSIPGSDEEDLKDPTEPDER